MAHHNKPGTIKNKETPPAGTFHSPHDVRLPWSLHTHSSSHTKPHQTVRPGHHKHLHKFFDCSFMLSCSCTNRTAAAHTSMAFPRSRRAIRRKNRIFATGFHGSVQKIHQDSSSLQGIIKLHCKHRSCALACRRAFHSYEAEYCTLCFLSMRLFVTSEHCAWNALIVKQTHKNNLH